jgi:hypothetical protein
MYTLELIRRVAIAAYSALALLVRPFSVFAWVWWIIKRFEPSASRKLLEIGEGAPDSSVWF